MKKTIAIVVLCILILGLVLTGCKKEDPAAGQDKNEEQGKPAAVENINEATELLDYVLYFRHKDKPFLFDEAYSVEKNDERLKNKTMEEFILHEAIETEGFGEYLNAVPKGTKLLSVERQQNVLVVNLSKEFVQGQKGTSNDTLLSIATIVNALTVQPENEKVQILIEGEKVDTINGIDCREPFQYIQGLYPDK
ncbi:GerMN domain-containing protein [Geosporobacter ferrireducens]|uniref:GerMN domain-containing protein n=1 Tax=Geosporobacter ferrireducens TaxID=1424294 RepID=A0A1D8GD23_9FIRM|nr:GerMN domain-containing protein [Geosporobacter ferrireducens]AOT68801.1 hypothetical protein Gferi_04030 [Geosporobacter ferrireducens]MTI56457.1 GerMN domain-containing protein [Geosporobacter ferrireducens]